ncbi:signal recognition particle-docking protein FtsY [Candidatus Poribacteria bacterium]|nr:signal recognition particle-docking protein FtsY [Candidatus Poribacteria bacterium]
MFRNLFRKGDKPATPTTEARPASPSPIPAETPAEPAPKKTGFFQRLREGLSKTRANLTDQLAGLLRMGRRIDDDLIDEIEELLIRADVGVNTTMELIERVRETVKAKGLSDAGDLHGVLRDEVLRVLGDQAATIDTTTAKPFVMLVVGVNGVGKTTTIGKLASRYRSEGKRVLVAAADTFRAAAIDQLEVWCQRACVEIIKQAEGSDAAAVVFDAIAASRSRGTDVLIVDTAGRLHTKTNLMQELAKISRVASREVPDAPHEVLLVLDATTGQNAVSQAQKFREIVPVSGIALTKLDSTAKGGIVIAVKHELDIPVKLIGIGESIEDLRDFVPSDFVSALFTLSSDEESQG